MRLDELENLFQRARWEEVIQHSIKIKSVEEDEVDEGFLVMELDEKDADNWGIYPILSISRGGTIAEYNVSQPYHYMTFGELMKAANVRQSIT